MYYHQFGCRRYRVLYFFIYLFKKIGINVPNCHHSPSHSLVKVLTLRHCFAHSPNMSNGSLCRCCCNVQDISEHERGELCSTYNSDSNRFSPQASQFLRWWAPQRGPRRMWWCNSSGTFTTLLSLKAVPCTVPSRGFLLLPVWTVTHIWESTSI